MRYSNDFGANWTALTEGLPESRGNRLELDTQGRLWVYGGEQIYFCELDSLQFDSLALPLNSHEVRDIAVVNPQTLWIATYESGAYWSNNLGQDWENVFINGLEEILAIEVNPQNSQAAILIGQESNYRTNIIGQWEAIQSPLDGRDWGGVSYLNQDSTQLLAIRGYPYVNNCFKSMNGGVSWQPELCDVLSYSVWRMQRIGSHNTSLVLLPTNGALLTRTEAESFSFVWTGKGDGVYTFSHHIPGLIYGETNHGLFISPDSGQTWSATPFVSGIFAFEEHTLRPALFVFRNGESFFRMDLPTMQIDSLGEAHDSHIHSVFQSEADTTLFFATAHSGLLYRSENGGSTWETIANPASATQTLGMLLSRSRTDIAFLYTKFNTENRTPFIWKTTNRGESWSLIHSANIPGVWEWISGGWTSGEVTEDLSFRLAIDGPPQSWYYYSTDGGETFDSVQTGLSDSGFIFYGWGDSTLALRMDRELDSAFLALNHGSQIEFIGTYPESADAGVLSAVGKYGQFAKTDYLNGGSWYFRLSDPVNAREGRPPWSVSATEIVSVYPNPTNSSVVLRLDNVLHDRPLRVDAYDILGRVVRLMDINSISQSTPIVFPLSGLPSGTYFLRVVTKNAATVPIKVVLQN